MKRIYTQSQVNKALFLINSGFTRKEAAQKAKIGIYSLNYYIAKKASPKLRKILLRDEHRKAIRSAIDALNSVL